MDLIGLHRLDYGPDPILTKPYQRHSMHTLPVDAGTNVKTTLVRFKTCE